MRALVLGDAKSGRTSVAQRLVKPTLAGSHVGSSPKNNGVSILEAVLSPKVSCQVWDFAAEIVTMPTHQFFISENTVYVIVFSLSDANSIRRIDYWMDLILGKVEQANIILVGTHADKSSVDADRVVATCRSKYRGRKHLLLHSVVIVNTQSVDSTRVWDSLQTLLISVSETSSLRSWVGKSVQQKAVYLRSVLQAERSLLAIPVVSLSTFRNIARSCKIKETEMDDCFGWLEYSAAVMFFESIPRLKDIVVIDVLWLVSLMNRVSSWKKPLVGVDELESVFPFPQFSSLTFPAILRLLEGFSIAHVFQNRGSSESGSPGLLTKSSDSGNKFLIPFLLSDTEPDLSIEDRIVISKHTGHTYRRIYEVSAWIHGLFEQLLIRMMHISTKHCSFWRKGFVFMIESGTGGWDLVVARLETNSNQDTSECARIFFDITSSDRSGRVLHLVATTVEGLVRGWFPGSYFKRLVISGEHELDLDALGEELMKIASKQELRGFSRSYLKVFFCCRFFVFFFV